MKADERTLRMRVHVTSPPRGVWFAVQRRKEDLLEPRAGDADGLRFSFTVRVIGPTGGPSDFRGDVVQGRPADRFVYVNSGTKARLAGEPWERRAKLKLDTIPDAMLERTLREDAVLEARFGGTADDGGAVCASLPVAAVEWRVVASGA